MNEALVLLPNESVRDYLSRVATYYRAKPSDLATTLAQLHEDRGQVDHAIEYWSMYKGRKDHRTDSLRVQAMLKSPYLGHKEMLQDHLDWAADHAVSLPDDDYVRFRPYDGKRKIRVGYACCWFDSSTIRGQGIPFIAEHDRFKFSPVGYSLGACDSSITRHFDDFYDVSALNDLELAKKIRRDQIDIFVEFTGFSPHHRLGTMGARCAPVQVSYLNHTGTSGVKNVDYILADPIAAPTEIDAHFTEAVYRLPSTFFVFNYDWDKFPKVDDPPSLSRGEITFGCFGSQSKINDAVIKLWSDVLHAVPNSRLFLRNLGLATFENRQFMERRFARWGIPGNRLRLQPGGSRDEIKANYNDVDISLDTWPYCGGNTIAESQWMGVPVVTLKGDRFPSAYGASLLHASGCSDLVAEITGGFVGICADLASDSERLVYYRRNLRKMMVNHGFGDAKRFTRDLEIAFEKMLSSRFRALPFEFTGMSAKKLLSIVIVGRNDDYLGGYRYRLQTCLDFLAANLKALGRLNDVEVLFVDWNSQGVTLADEIQLTADAASLMRFVIVPPGVAKARNMLVPFFTTCAVNVGIRRAEGQFIMLADSDSMMPRSSLNALLNVLDGTLPTIAPSNELIYPIPRHQIPGAIAARRPNVAAWMEILKRLTASRRKELPAGDCLGGFSAAQLMHRDLWLEFGAYNEHLDRAWGWSDNELMLRVTQKYNWMDLGYHGVIAFHIEHFASTSGDASARDPNSVNRMLLRYDTHPNEDDWGLGNQQLVEKRVSGTVQLDDVPTWAPLSYKVSNNDAVSTLAAVPAIQDFTSRVAHANVMEPHAIPSMTMQFLLRPLVLIEEYPRNVVYVGTPRWSPLLALIEANPGIDLFLIQPWKQGYLEGREGDPGMLSMLLANNGYRGFARIVSQRAPVAIDNLAASDPMAQEFDLVVVDRADVEEDFSELMPRLLKRLASGGALVLIDENGRTPYDPENARVFLGRLLARSAIVSGSGHSAFAQTPEETRLGEAFDVIPFGRGVVHMVRKRPHADLSAARIAAE